jgi:hypothetical protein
VPPEPEKVAVHVAVPPLPDSVQEVGENDPPDGDAEKVTVPVGVNAVPAELSVTVAVHVQVPWLREQDTVTVTLRWIALTEVLPELPE